MSTTDFVTITLFGFWTAPVLKDNGDVKVESKLVKEFNYDTCIHRTEENDSAYVKVQGVKGEYTRNTFHRAATRKPRTCSLFRTDFESKESASWLTKYKRGSVMDLEHNEWFYNKRDNNALDVSDW